METVTVDKSKNEALFNRKEIKNTPFEVISTKEGHFIALGQYRLSELYEKQDEAVKEANKITWNRLFQVIGIVMESYKLNKNN